MISIIICSCNFSELLYVKENIDKTIGVPYEVIVIGNTENKYNIFSAYNEGIKKAKGDVLCFMHEDLIFHTQGWGKYVENHLKDESIGLIGVYGAHFMPDCFPVCYWSNPCSGHLLQGTKTDDYSPCVLQKYESHQGDANEIEVAVMDGLWLCGHRRLFEEIQFDDKTFNGFHCYDIDICMQSLMAGKRNIVVNDVFIEHKSLGQTSVDFFMSLKLWYTKWQKMLPIYRGIQKNELPWNDLSLAGYYIRQKKDADAGWKTYKNVIESRRYKLATKICSWLHI